MSSKDLIKLLKENGWVLDRTKGSHSHFRHPKRGNVVTVPHPKKDLPKGLVKAVLKQAGLDYNLMEKEGVEE